MDILGELGLETTRRKFEKITFDVACELQVILSSSVKAW